MSKKGTGNISWKYIKSLRTDLLARFPNDRFLEKLLAGVTRTGRDKKNPIRGNLVASVLREVIGHVLHSLAPDGQVRDCVWFEQAKDTDTVTRRQRAKYIVFAGLPGDFVEQRLRLNIDDFVDPLLDAIKALNKATHVRSETIVYKGRKVRFMVQDVLGGVINLLEAASASREELKQALASVMHDAVFQNLISDTIPDLDELSTHTTIDGHYIDKVEVCAMDARRITYEITGQVEVDLQYGSNSDVKNDIGFRQDDSYPYRAIIVSEAAKPLDIHSGNVELTVDNSSFYD